MGNKTTLYNNKNGHNSFRPATTPHVYMGGIQKKVHEAKTSRMGRRARDIVKKNLSFFTKSINPLIKLNSTNNLLLSSSSSNSACHTLPSNEEQDAPSHQLVLESLSQEYALHASPSWQYVASTIGEPRFPPVDNLPRTWKESLKEDQHDIYCFTAKQAKYQELIYEIIMTEQSYVDDLILIYKIFIKESLHWDGLPAAVKHLFENVFQIIRLHLQLLKELRNRQLETHPVVESITDICRSFISRFEVYSAYFSKFEKASNIITESIKQQDELGRYISRRSLWAECRNLTFLAYLLTPIQRVMKYPLFFKSLAECLSPLDTESQEIDAFLLEMDIILRHFEKQKKESEDFIKLEDLAGRIKGLEGSTIHIAEHGRRLIYEGYLTIVPGSELNLSSSTRLEEPSVSFSSSIRPALSRRNSTFSISSRKAKKAYVFLFNDMIVCTRERDKRRSNPTEHKSMSPPPRKDSYYGPSPDSLFKITHTPGKITLVNRALNREIVNGNNDKSSRRGSALFQSFRRYGSRVNDDNDSNFTPYPKETSQTSYFTSQSCHDLYDPKSQPQITLERHPLQFICSVATKNLANICFEAETPKEKDTWCQHMESVLDEHVQRNNYTPTNQQQQFGEGNNRSSSSHLRATLSPNHSTYSFESVSSSESLAFPTAWTGYCDVERMDIDDMDTSAQFSVDAQTEENFLGNNTVSNKSQDLLQTIMGEFGDSIWQMGAPPGMSPLQLRHAFFNVGSQL